MSWPIVDLDFVIFKGEGVGGRADQGMVRDGSQTNDRGAWNTQISSSATKWASEDSDGVSPGSPD